MRVMFLLLAGIAVAQTTPCFAKQRRAKVSGSAGSVPAESPTQSDGAPTPSVAPAVRSSHQAMETRPKRYITDGGNPAPGRILVTPMVGQYALSGFEIGAKASVRIVDHGFVPALNNSISIEAEAFKGKWHSVFGDIESMFYGVLGRWDFHLAPKWTAYGAAGLLQEREQSIAGHEADGVSTEVNVQVGGMMILTDNFRLRAEFDYAHASARFGAVLAL